MSCKSVKRELKTMKDGMLCRSIKRELKTMKDGIGSISRRLIEEARWRGCRRSSTAPEAALSEPVEQGQWANLPPELLLDIISRVEESETTWPARISVIFCASVCRSWRDVSKKIVKTPEECGTLTLPISLKQPGPRDFPIQCFIKRDRTASVYRLYLGLLPSKDENDKFLLAAKKATSNDFVISLAADGFSQDKNSYIGKLRSNFLRTKFTIYDRQSPFDATYLQHDINLQSRRFHTKLVCTISYQVNPPSRRGPRRMHCSMLPAHVSQEKELTAFFSFHKPSRMYVEALVVENKAPRWHEQMQCWCLDFKGRVTEKSIKNFQLLAGADQDKIILQFGRIGRDLFIMDYCHPLSAFQAFGICLSSFDANPACVG